jgi:hypothetical protein
VFSVCTSQRAIDGLMLGLNDHRFEVRFQSARSLAAIVEKHRQLRVDREMIFEVVQRETAVGRPVWESHRLLNQLEDRNEHFFVDDFVKDRASRSLAHTFTLLSLVLPAEPLASPSRPATDDPTSRYGARAFEVLRPSFAWGCGRSSKIPPARTQTGRDATRFSPTCRDQTLHHGEPKEPQQRGTLRRRNHERARKSHGAACAKRQCRPVRTAADQPASRRRLAEQIRLAILSAVITASGASLAMDTVIVPLGFKRSVSPSSSRRAAWACPPRCFVIRHRVTHRHKAAGLGF